MMITYSIYQQYKPTKRGAWRWVPATLTIHRALGCDEVKRRFRKLLQDERVIRQRGSGGFARYKIKMDGGQ